MSASRLVTISNNVSNLILLINCSWTHPEMAADLKSLHPFWLKITQLVIVIILLVVQSKVIPYIRVALTALPLETRVSILSSSRDTARPE